MNDGSEDDTKIIAAKWCEKDSRFKYVEQENKGVSAARNKGIRISKGEFILPLDADDYIVETFLEKLTLELEQDCSIDIVSCYTKFFKKNIENVVEELKPKGTNFRDLLFVNQLIVSSLFRKKIWEEIGGYDEHMKDGFEDWDFWLNFTKRGYKFKIIEEFLFYYRKAKKSRQADAIANHFDSIRMYIFKKHKELYIEDFDNCLRVLFFEINQQRNTNKKMRNSIEYKIGKVIMKPFKMVTQLFFK